MWEMVVNINPVLRCEAPEFRAKAGGQEGDADASANGRQHAFSFCIAELLVRVGSLFLDAPVKQDLVSSRRHVFTSTVCAQNPGHLAHTSQRLFQQLRKLVFGLVQENHGVARIRIDKNCEVAVLVQGQVLGADVDHVHAHDARFDALRGRWKIAPADIGVRAIMTRNTKLSNGFFDADAVVAKLGDLGRVRVPKAVMQFFLERDRAKLMMRGVQGVRSSCKICCF